MIALLFRILARLPLRALHALGGALGWLAWLASPDLRARLRANLPVDLPDRPRVLRRAVAEGGRQVLELAWVWSCPPEQLAARVHTPDRTVLDAALAEPRPLLMLTPHLGCFEAIAQSYMASAAGRARPMLALYREPRKAALRPLFADARARSGLRLAPADLQGVRRMLRELRAGGVVGLLPDQVPSRGEGVWAPFFGRPAYTMTLPARLAREHGALVLLVWARRLPRGAGFTLHWHRLDTPLTGEAMADATILNAAMEGLIRACPEQYLWSYKRYKVPAGVKPPGQPAA